LIELLPDPIAASPAWYEDVVFLLDADLRFVICNSLWDKFAAENGGHDIAAAEMAGKKILDYVPDLLHQFYQQKYWLARREATGTSFDYDCSSPEKIRLLRMSIVPFGDELVVSNHLLLEEDCACEEEVNEDAYISASGYIIMCANCRKTKRRDGPELWTWIPSFLNQASLQVTHGLCPRCIKHLYE
jgi:hypothetical protein